MKKEEDKLFYMIIILIKISYGMNYSIMMHVGLILNKILETFVICNEMIFSLKYKDNLGVFIC